MGSSFSRVDNVSIYSGEEKRNNLFMTKLPVALALILFALLFIKVAMNFNENTFHI